MSVEKSLVLLKPDAYLRRYVGACILKEFLKESELQITAFKEVKVSRELAEKHYAVHRDKPFFRKLIDFITVAPVIAMIVSGEDAIRKIREMLGATFSHKAEPNTIRGRYGIWDGINVVHASDAVETGVNEINLWRNEANLMEEEVSIVDGKIREYIEKWSSVPVDHTMELRELCRKMIEEGVKEEYVKKMSELLREECYDSSIETVENLVRVILDSLK
ncbi:MAG: nucleoside-diphosphate kinase [Candidatus Odinarchaeia archaeon]